jgi:hypothetical protein
MRPSRPVRRFTSRRKPLPCPMLLRPGEGLAGSRPGPDAQVLQFARDSGRVLAAVGGDRAERPAGPAGDALDCGGELPAVGCGAVCSRH